MTQTTADLLFAQGKEQGIAQGKEQGIEQGERKGTIESILALLGTRFQPNAVQALKPTLETINLLRLKELLLAAPQTQSLEAFTQTLHE
jgi:flagellar biosynthesis/type III secretory pathway protein FliH